MTQGSNDSPERSDPIITKYYINALFIYSFNKYLPGPDSLPGNVSDAGTPWWIKPPWSLPSGDYSLVISHSNSYKKHLIISFSNSFFQTNLKTRTWRVKENIPAALLWVGSQETLFPAWLILSHHPGKGGVWWSFPDGTQCFFPHPTHTCTVVSACMHATWYKTLILHHEPIMKNWK